MTAAPPPPVSPYLGCMLAHELDESRIVYPVAVEDKLDGFRVTHVGGAGYTRNGRSYDSFRPFSAVLHAGAPGLHVDTEMCGENWNETSKLLKRIKNVDVSKIRASVTCHVFDVFDAESLGQEIYTERRRAVEYVVTLANEIAAREPYPRPLFGDDVTYRIPGPVYKFVASQMVIVNNQDELEAAYLAALARGREGVMVKTLDGVYTTGRSRTWQKRKPFRDITITVTGAEHGHGLCPVCMTANRREDRAEQHNRAVYGTGATFLGRDDVKPDPNCHLCRGAATGVERSDLLGALLGATESGASIKVGMGFTDAQKQELWQFRAELVGRKCDVKVQAEAGTNAIIARHPVFVRWRDDLR